MKQKKDFNKKLALNILIIESEILDSEIELLQEKLDLIREELCKIIGVNPNLEKQGHEDNYIFNLNIDLDNQISFLLQATEL